MTDAMAMPAEEMDADEFVFYLDFDGTASAGAVGRLLSELERLARLKRNFGPDFVLELVEIRTGSLWIKIKRAVKEAGIVGLMAAGGSAAAMGSFAIDVGNELSKPQSQLTRCITEIDKISPIKTIVTKTCYETTDFDPENLPFRRAPEEKRAMPSPDFKIILDNRHGLNPDETKLKHSERPVEPNYLSVPQAHLTLIGRIEKISDHLFKLRTMKGSEFMIVKSNDLKFDFETGELCFVEVTGAVIEGEVRGPLELVSGRIATDL